MRLLQAIYLAHWVYQFSKGCEWWGLGGTCLNLRVDRCLFHPRSPCRLPGWGQLSRATASGHYLWQKQPLVNYFTAKQNPTTQLMRAAALLASGSSAATLTRRGVPYEERDEVGDGRLALSDTVKAASGEVLRLLSSGQLVQSQVVLLLEELPRTRCEPWDTQTDSQYLERKYYNKQMQFTREQLHWLTLWSGSRVQFTMPRGSSTSSVRQGEFNQRDQIIERECIEVKCFQWDVKCCYIAHLNCIKIKMCNKLPTCHLAPQIHCITLNSKES